MAIKNAILKSSDIIYEFTTSTPNRAVVAGHIRKDVYAVASIFTVNLFVGTARKQVTAEFFTERQALDFCFDLGLVVKVGE